MNIVVSRRVKLVTRKYFREPSSFVESEQRANRKVTPVEKYTVSKQKVTGEHVHGPSMDAHISGTTSR